MEPMDVDPPSSSSKRPVTPPSPSPPAEQCRKVPLQDAELSMLNDNMGRRSNEGMWPIFIKKAEAGDTPWLTVFSNVLMSLTEELSSTDLRGSVIASPNLREAENIVNNFNTDELQQWKMGVRSGVERNEWIDLLAHPKLKSQIPKMPDVRTMLEPFYRQVVATENSWERPYVGKTAEALWAHIQNHYDPNGNKFYAHFCSVVQSSGMGKSRTVDELGKEHFSIPINLRDSRSSGYPPTDYEVLYFLTEKSTEEKSYRRACCFLDALFQHTDYTLKMKFGPRWDIGKVVREFRIAMTAGQTIKKRNEFRKGFYEQVVRLARGLMFEKATDYNSSLSTSCHKFVESLKARRELSPLSAPKEKTMSTAGQDSGGTEDSYPLVILAFDEVHTLADLQGEEYTTWSNFSGMRRAFHALRRFPLFALFMSTTSKISQFPSPDENPSKRIIAGTLTLIQPFTDFGLDTLAKKVSLNDQWDLERVTSDSHIVYLGRPLFGSRYDAGNRIVRGDIVSFAVAKLLNADPDTTDLTQDQLLACLSRRLPIEFNSKTSASRTAERKQVEAHMRVCLNIDAAFGSMETVSSSEPLLSEAAYATMARRSFDLLESFKRILEGFVIHKGDRGELLGLLLLTLARDQAVGPPDRNGHPVECDRFFGLASFMYGYLFRRSPSASELGKLQHDFPQAVLHFNHFIKIYDYESIEKENLLLMTRGAGVLCNSNHASIDAVTVFLRSGTKLGIDNLGLVLYQIRNDPRYSDVPNPEFFESMNPYDLGILKEEDAPVPIIRIFFALAAETPGLHVTRHAPSSTYGAVIYDIWSAGLSSDFLSPIGPHADIWDSLLQASFGWKESYKTATDLQENLLRSMNPGAAEDGGHWSH